MSVVVVDPVRVHAEGHQWRWSWQSPSGTVHRGPVAHDSRHAAKRAGHEWIKEQTMRAAGVRIEVFSDRGAWRWRVTSPTSNRESTACYQRRDDALDAANTWAHAHHDLSPARIR